jgi:type II secretory pathway component PulF
MNEYYTLESLLAYPTAVIAVSLVTAVIVYLVPKAADHGKWISAGLALFLAYLMAFTSAADWTGYIVAFFNACVLFCASVGLNVTTGRKATEVPTVPWVERGVHAWDVAPSRSLFWGKW